MAKSLRSKREKRLRTIRRELVGPFYDKKDAAKLTALEAALAAPKVPVRTRGSGNDVDDGRGDGGNEDMLTAAADAPMSPGSTGMDVEMAESDGGFSGSYLKPSGGVGKKKKKWGNIKLGKHRRHRRKGKKPSLGRKKLNF